MFKLFTKTRHAIIVAVFACLSITLAPAPSASAHEGHATADPFNALIFSKTAAFRHDSIPAGIEAITKLAGENNFTVDATEDANAFTDENLANYDVVIWLSTTGDVLNADQQAAFERYIAAGGGYAGVHAASDTEYEWPWYGELVGAYFAGHPEIQDATVKVEDPAHPSTAGMAPTWRRNDEWYNFRTNPLGKVHVLASLDETSYSGSGPGGSAMGNEHPISWCRDYEGGRAWYTGMGHTIESYSDPQFLHHLLGGIQTAAGVLPGDCAATLESSFEKVTLDDNTANPMELDIADDGRVFYIDRGGDIRLIGTGGSVSTVGHVNVTTVQEFGLLGIALDPNFTTNGFMYLYWSPADQPTKDRVSRFTIENNQLQADSEKVVLELDVQRAECCHAGGALEFDGNGNLYVATGDNTNPFASDGYTPIDERDGRASWDAQRSAGNTNSLSGKVLRIHPEADGTYTVPEGNLFAPGTDKTRPEIYAMGFRNPFRIGLDEQTNSILVADYGPDAGAANANRGPGGRTEWNIVDKPGNYGWPYCVGKNTPYNDYNFETSTSGPAFDCANIVNDSPNNTGLTNLPPAIEATMWHGNDGTSVPEIGGSGAPMTSGTYAYNPDLASDRKWPAYFDGKAIWADWNNSRFFSVLMNTAHDDVADVTRFLPNLEMTRPHALQFGPDGALYMIEWGSGFGGNNADSGVYRIDYVQGNRSPIARAGADKTSGPAPLSVKFDSTGSRDPDGTDITFAWDFNGDDQTDSTEAAPEFTFTEPGEYPVKLTVTDADGRSGTSNLTIVAGNTAPELTVEAPADGSFFDFGDSVRYQVSGTDAEDGAIDCAAVTVQPALGHDEHAHPYDQYHGCEGVVEIPGDEGHLGANIFGTISVKYTDKGAPGTVSLTTEKVIVLHPKRREAEFFQQTGRIDGSTSGGTPGVQLATTGDSAGGGQSVEYIEPGDYFGWDVMNLSGIQSISLRAASPNAGGATWEIRSGDPNTGEVVGTIDVANTGDWQVYQDFTVDLPGTTAPSAPLYFVQTAGGSNVNWVDFGGRGATDNQRPTVSLEASVTNGSAPLAVNFVAEANDPDGDEPLTYAWNFGDGTTGEGAEASHVYQNPGTYNASVVVTDARGASNRKSVSIQVSGSSLGSCFSGRSDDFTGAALDTSRWDSVVRLNQELTVTDGQLNIPLTATDIHGAGTAVKTPNLVLQKLPQGPFEITSKVTLAARQQYQQAGLLIYGDDDNYLKMVIQGRTTSPDKAGRVFQFLGEVAGAATETNTSALGQEFPDTFWVRMSSTNGTDVTASYSADGVDFTAMPGDSRSLSHIAEPKMGMFGLANGEEAAGITASFDNFVITPDDSVEPREPSDEFDGDAVDVCRWNASVRALESQVRVNEGNLEIDTSKGDIYGADNTAPNNFVLQSAPEGDWVAETMIDGSAFNQAYHQGGLIAYVDDDNYAKLDLLATNNAGSAVVRGLELRSEVGGVVQEPQPNQAVEEATWRLRLTKVGDSLTGAYSADGETWSDLGTVANSALTGNAVRIGLFGLGNNQTESATAKFDYFRLSSGEPPVDDEVAPEVSISTDPDNADWVNQPVEVTVTANDDQDSAPVVEYRIDDGDWTAYDGPVLIDAEGAHRFDARATDAAGNVSEVASEQVRIDVTGPEVTVSNLKDGANLGLAADRRVKVAVSDATSGVNTVSITLDGQPVASPVRIDALRLLTGKHVLEVISTDLAGNQSTHTVNFTVVARIPGMRALVERLSYENRITTAQTKTLNRQLDAVQRAVDAQSANRIDNTMNKFIATGQGVQDAVARTALVDGGRHLRDFLLRKV